MLIKMEQPYLLAAEASAVGPTEPYSTWKLPSAAALQLIIQNVLNETRGVPGIAASVSLRGKRISACAGLNAQDGHLPLGEDSRFTVSCLMKFMVSLCIMHLCSHGRLDLESPASMYLPTFFRRGDRTPVSIRHLLSHTSGYAGPDIDNAKVLWGMDLPLLERLMETTPQRYVPGAVFNYEHADHVFLGEIIRQITSTDPIEFVKSVLIKPANASLSTPQQDRQWKHLLAGQHRYVDSTGRFERIGTAPVCALWAPSLSNSTMSTNELVSVIAHVIDPLRSHEFMDCRNWHELTSRSAAMPRQIAIGGEQSPIGYTAGCLRYPQGMAGHNGSTSGQTTAVRFNVDAQFVVAVGVNGYSPYARDAAIDRIISAVTGSQPAVASKSVVFSKDQWCEDLAFEELAGSYHGSYFCNAEVSSHVDALEVRLGAKTRGGPVIFLRRESDQTFELKSNMPVALGFYRERTSRNPVLALNMFAYGRS